MTKAARAEALLADGAAARPASSIGTHALLEEHVQFADLGLVVVDEQHRFGVEQRAALTDKAGTPPHVLVMTATPIPRTVAMTVFGDLEVSTLTELPAGRAPIQTNVVPARRAARAGSTGSGSGCARRSSKGHQVVRRVPADHRRRARGGRVRRSSTSTRRASRSTARPRRCAAVEEVAAGSRTGRSPGLRLDVLHGRLPPDEKDRAMRAFAAGDIDVLVATTVIEVGVDVANATTMVLLDADRFGVSQLHQLRGRVGRGGLPGLCLLVTHAEADTPGPRAPRRRGRAPPTASSSAGSTSSSAARATCSARRSRASAPACSSCACSATRTRSSRRARPRPRLLADDPELARAPDLPAARGRDWSNHGSLTSWRSHEHAP